MLAKPKRDKEWKRLRRQRFRLSDIGKAYGVTKGRVHQVVKDIVPDYDIDKSKLKHLDTT